jgi:hypothetical protein
MDDQSKKHAADEKDTEEERKKKPRVEGDTSPAFAAAERLNDHNESKKDSDTSINEYEQNKDNDKEEGEEEESGFSEDERGGAFSDSSEEGHFLSARESMAILRLNAERDSEDEDNSYSEDSDSSEDFFFGGSSSVSTEFATRVALINGACSTSFHAAEVRGNHTTSCDDCEQVPSYGNYAVDQSRGVYDAPKLCEECVNFRSEQLFTATTDMDYYREIKRMERALKKKTFAFNPFIRDGLYDKGPSNKFRLWRKGESKMFEGHMA